MTTISAPATHGQTVGDLGLSYQYLDAMVRLALAEKFDPVAGMLVGPPVQFARSGTDTARFRRVGGLGFSKTFDAMPGETDGITASGWTSAYDSITLGRKGLAYESSFQADGLSSDGVTLEAIASGIASSLSATLRADICTTGATITGNVADAASTADVDDFFSLINTATATEGFGGTLNLILKPRQVGRLRSSLRAETLSLNAPDMYQQYGAIIGNAGFQFSFLGVNVWASKDVVSSGGYDWGFAFAPGAIQWGVMDTNAIGDISDAHPVYVPEYGLVITRKTTGDQALKRISANAFYGVGKLDAAVAPQFLFKNDDGV